MQTVTYRGPEDPRDPTTRYCIQHDRKSFYFPKGLPISVSNEIAALAGEQEGHDFDIGEATDGRDISTPARKLAEEEDFDLDSIEGDGPIGVNDVREAIKQAQEAKNQES